MTAYFSPCRNYRYHLARSVGAGDPTPGSICLFVMLNPSTADSSQDDPTIRRCREFARREGCSVLEVVNLFAWRSTLPEVLESLRDPVGPENDDWIRTRAAAARIVIAAWGARGDLRGRGDEVCAMLPRGKTFVLGFTKAGHPRHPLYLPRNAPLVPWPMAGGVQ